MMFPDVDKMERLRKDQIPALLGQLEDLKSHLLLRLLQPEPSESAQAKHELRLECSRCGYRIREGEEQPRTSVSPLLTYAEVAKVLDMSKSWIKREIKSGRLKAKRFGSLIRIQEDDLKEYINAKDIKQS